MHKFFISQYVSRITKNDVQNFALKNNISLNDNELDIIYTNLKQNWETILYDDPTRVFKILKGQLSPDSYEKGIRLYHEYHNLYKDYL